MGKGCLLCCFVAAVVMSCGAEENPQNQPAAPPGLFVSVGDVSPEGEVVARVNGAAIDAACVRRQALAHSLSREAALAECIDFELLAQQANSPKYLDREEVQQIGKEAMVRAFVGAHYTLNGPADFPADMIQTIWDKINVPKFNHPELRNIVYCRVQHDSSQPHRKDGSDTHPQAEAFFAEIYRQLRGKTGLEKNDLFALCYEDEAHKKAGVPELELFTHNLMPRQNYAPEFRDKVFAPQVPGQVIAPIHTRYGWDIVLVTEIQPELSTEFKDGEGELREALFEQPIFEPQRQSHFDEWMAPFLKRHKIERFAKRLRSGMSPESETPQ